MNLTNMMQNHPRLVRAVYNSYDTIFEGNYSTDSLLYYIQTENGPVLQNTGLTMSSFLHSEEEYYCHPEDRRLFHNTFSAEAAQESIESGQTCLFIRLRRTNKSNGDFHWWSYHIEFTVTAEQAIIITVCARDIHGAELTHMENLAIFKSLSSIYSYTFLVNLDEDTCKNVSHNSRIHSSQHTISYSRALKYIEKNFIYPEDVQTFYEYTTPAGIQAKLRSFNHIEFEFRLTLNKKLEWIRLCIIPVELENSSNDVIIAGNIITSQKQEEQKSKDALMAAYVAANRATEAKSQFLKNMSHDIRTPMNAILGYCTMAGAHAGNPAKILDYMDKISVAGNHLLKLINDILDMSQIEDGKTVLSCKKFDLEAELKNIVHLIRPEMEKHNHTFITDISDLDGDIVNTDMLKLQQILLNVLSNAAKYTPDNGQVIFIVNKRPSNIMDVYDYEFIIRDTGMGIKPEFLEHIFEPFSRSNEVVQHSIEGTGLGLAIVQNLVKIMNGNIYVDSSPGNGTKVTIFLPMVCTSLDTPATDEPCDTKTSISELIRTHDYSGKRLLVAEDNLINAEIITECLAGTGVILEYAHTGAEAVSMFHEHPCGYYDVILMDVQMPYMDGYEATRNIRKDLANGGEFIPILAMTANAFSSDVKNARDAGMNEHLSKPLDIHALFHVLDRYLSNPC